MLPPNTKGIELSATSSPSPSFSEVPLQSSTISISDVAMDNDPTPGSSSSSTHTIEAPSASSGKAKIVYDPTYYIDSTFVVFQLQNTLFRVPSYMLTDGSQFFKGMFRLPQPPGNGDSGEGLSDSNPIVIPENSSINSDEFRHFMKVLYPRSVSTTLKLSKTEWISVLKVSRIWYFLDIRAVAISELEKGGELTYIDKIVLGRQNWISTWVLEGLTGLVERKDTISDEDAIQIDYITAVKLFRLREERIERRMGWNGICEAVRVVFSDEVAHVASEERALIATDDDIQLPDPGTPHVAFTPIELDSPRLLPRAASPSLAALLEGREASPVDSPEWSATPIAAGGIKKKKKKCSVGRDRDM